METFDSQILININGIISSIIRNGSVLNCKGVKIYLLNAISDNDGENDTISMDIDECEEDIISISGSCTDSGIDQVLPSYLIAELSSIYINEIILILFEYLAAFMVGYHPKLKNMEESISVISISIIILLVINHSKMSIQ